MFSLLSFLCLVAVGWTAGTVHELTASTFDAFIADHELSLIEFVASWCPFSQELEPEFESAAQTLLQDGWPLARVDCEEQKELCTRYPVPIFPTIRVFHGANHSIYNGFRQADAIVPFVKRHAQPLVTELSSSQDVERFRKTDRVTVVAYINPNDDDSRKIFEDLAGGLRDKYLFGVTSDETFGQAEDVQSPSLVLFKTFDEGKDKFDGPFEEELMKEFIADWSTPLLSVLGQDINEQSIIFGAGEPVAFVFSEDPDQQAELIEQLRSVAHQYRDAIDWVVVDPSKYEKPLALSATKPGKWPAFGLQHQKGDFKFAYPERGSVDALNAEAIQKLLKDFLSDQLTTHVLSEPVPAEQSGPIVTVVADTYEELVMDESRDVFVLFYSPTCSHCKAMKAAYNAFAEALESCSDRVTIGQINVKANDVRPEVTSFPTMKLFKSGSKEAPLEYDGDRTMDDFVQFMIENGSQDYAVNLRDKLHDRIGTHDEL